MDMKVRKTLETLEQKLHSAPKHSIFLSDSWASEITLEAGVYAVWTIKSHAPEYVGQTTSLRHRMRDLGRQINHTFPRGIAKKMKNNPNDEAVRKAISRTHVVSYIEVQIGRAELEDYLRLRWRETVMNGPANRLLQGERYKWIMPT